MKRRDLLRAAKLIGALAAFLGLRGRSRRDAHHRKETEPGPDIYKSIGIRPFINCRGTLTVISGSLELSEFVRPKTAPLSTSSRSTT